MTSEEFSAYLRSMLDSRGIRYTFVAEKLGITKQTLNKKMHNIRKWTIDEFSMLVKLLGIDPNILL